MDLHDVEFLPSTAGFYTTFLENHCIDLHLMMTACLKTVVKTVSTVSRKLK